MIVMYYLTKPIFVLLLAVFVTTGVGLSVVQASTVHLTMVNKSSEMKMSSDMNMSGLKECPDCGMMIDSKAMLSCVASACAALMAFLNTPNKDIRLVFNSVYHLDQTRPPDGAGSEPSPYPPRTTHIG